jgi:hypothetical protein
MIDSDHFESLEHLFKELETAFQPPKCEFRVRTQFLNLRQGKMDLYSYVQRARYLVASLVKEPMQEQTKLTVFLNGLSNGPIRTYLYRMDMETMEEAIATALEEDFSLKAASRDVQGESRQNHQVHNRPSSKMELSVVQSNPAPRFKKTWGGRNGTNGGSMGKPMDKSKIVCRRCKKLGHYASECRAPAPMDARPMGRSYGANAVSVRDAGLRENERSQ